MLTETVLKTALARAALAPSVHNTQPARWRREGEGLLLGCDLSVGLSVGDPDGTDAGLSCGAAAEALVLALSALGIAAEVEDRWAGDDRTTWPGHRIAARLTFAGGEADQLNLQLEKRFTFRGAFAEGRVKTFDRDDAVLLTEVADQRWIRERNDWASLEIMKARPFRRELLRWMRLSPSHPRHDFDGMNRAAMRMSGAEALGAPIALGPLWPVLHLLGLTKGLTAEAGATRTAQVIACFHRPAGESPVASGRAYLRMWLQATALGYAGWPMAALSDHPATRAEVCDRAGIGPDRRLVQVMRLGKPAGAMPPRARRPLTEVLIPG